MPPKNSSILSNGLEYTFGISKYMDISGINAQNSQHNNSRMYRLAREIRFATASNPGKTA